MLDENNIKSRIHTIRGIQVMLDSDLADLYSVATGNLNKAVKRNIERFPDGFMFQLTKKEYENLKFQTGISSWGGARKLPFVFTEQGVAMLSGVLRSNTAVKVSIQIINAFVAMRRFLASNAEVFQRLDKVEHKQLEYDQKLDKVFNAIESKGIKPEKGIFYDGQVFDAYKFVSDLIRSANKSVILIDNYIDDSVLTLFCKRKKGVKVRIFTNRITRELRQDLEKYNYQYPKIEVKRFKHSHDRFLIVDDKVVYHIGASLKDLGKRWFGFSRFDREVLRMLDRL